MAAPGLIVAPACHDPLTARTAEQVGYEAVYLGGFAYGASSSVSEPRLTMTEMVEAARRITAVVDVPLIVDAGTGFGDPLHVMRTVQEFERAGVAGIHIEDQVFPKRAHYHRDYAEHVIPAEEMAIKIEFACRARLDPDFVLIARTDAMRTDGFEEGMRRAKLYMQAGADAVMVFPNSVEEACKAPSSGIGPLVYTNSSGNRVGRPVFSTQELDRMGWKIDIEAICVVSAAYRAVRETLSSLKEVGRSGLDEAEARRLRKAIEDTIGLEEYYKIEEQTVESALRRGLGER